MLSLMKLFKKKQSPKGIEWYAVPSASFLIEYFLKLLWRKRGSLSWRIEWFSRRLLHGWLVCSYVGLADWLSGLSCFPFSLATYIQINSWTGRWKISLFYRTFFSPGLLTNNSLFLYSPLSTPDPNSTEPAGWSLRGAGWLLSPSYWPLRSSYWSLRHSGHVTCLSGFVMLP